jgi:prepilin-type N-terminal cleavage/methylation domain-containing protein
MRSSTNHASRYRPPASGFTLVELLVTVLIGGFVTLGLTAMLQAEFRSSSSILRFQRSSRHADQARRFMEAEAARASRVEVDDSGALVLHGVHPGRSGDNASYTIRYSAIPAEEMNNIDISFRGPYVLQREGPLYRENNGAVPDLDPSGRGSGVLLDGLAAESPFRVVEVADASGSSLGASLTFNLQGAAEAAIPHTFLIGVATSPALAVLQQPQEQFVSNCGTAGCRNTTIPVDGGSRTIQEWDTRLLTGTSPRVIPSGQTTAGGLVPDQVIIYFNSPRPPGNAIRRSSGTNSGSCIRTQCRIVIESVNYQVQPDNAASRWVDLLVFLDGVVAVPAN